MVEFEVVAAMLNLKDRGDAGDVFLDSVDCLSSEEESVASEEGYIADGVLGYEPWRSEPRSVKERRDVFLQKMGLNEFVARNESNSVNSMEVGVDKITEFSEAVSTSFDLSPCDHENDTLVYSGREEKGEANVMVGDREHDQLSKLSVALTGDTHVEKNQSLNSSKKKVGYWWREFRRNRRTVVDICKHEATKNANIKPSGMRRIKVHVKKKMFKEVSALYLGQEIQAHKGVIWTMKFSPDAQYLASGGQDGVVRIWRVTSASADGKSFANQESLHRNREKGKPGCRRKATSHVHVVIPDEIFQIEESPLQALHGHTGDVLDLAWSNDSCLLSSSTDKTVRLWRVGFEQCLHVFHHPNYVTSVQFCPIDDNYFISGSIDGKVRIWGVLERRVLDWADIRDVVTAICYQPDGKGFVVGSLTGTCRFYEAFGSSLELKADFQIHGSNKSFGNRVTSIQFCLEDPHKVMLTSEGSRLHIFDRTDVVLKYGGLSKSGSQTSASFTSNGRHTVSVGADSHVYVWNHETQYIGSSGRAKSMHSCEYFHSEGVRTAVPWSGRLKLYGSSYLGSHFSEAQGPQRPACKRRESKLISLMNWFSKESSLRDSTATWPEEILPLANLSPEQWQGQHQQDNHSLGDVSATWGLVIVTGSWDGVIRTFHNYGLPVRI
ncbi:hypothetical protein Ancab_002939 [Ancistrocladus abbreviatus]